MSKLVRSMQADDPRIKNQITGKQKQNRQNKVKSDLRKRK